MNGTFEAFGLVINFEIIALGVVTGMAYGLLAVGLVLVYRSSKVINFAHGEIGAFGAAVFGVAVTQWHVPYWLAIPLALAVSASIGGVAEVAVVRRLRNAPKLMSLVATLGLTQVLLFSSQLINASATNNADYPQPTGLPTFTIGTLVLTRAYVGLLLFSPLVVLSLVLFLRYSRFGLALRAAAANPEAAQMAGVFSARMSTLAWSMAGAVAALTAVLLKPTLGFVTAETLGPNLLLRALVAAVIARMSSLPVALAAGVGVGVVENVLKQSYPSAGVVEVVLFGITLLVLLLQTRRGGRDEEKSNWGSVQPWAPLSGALRRAPLVRRLGTTTGIAFIAVLALLPLAVSNQSATTMTFILTAALIGLSVGIITGLAGQLSLGQFAIAGIGAAVSYHVAYNTGNFPLAFLLAGVTGAGVSVLIGLPALRIKGLLLAVTTLSFALASERYFLQQRWLLGGGVEPGQPVVGGRALDTGKTYYLFAVAVFALCLLLTRNAWRSGLGRRLRALRDNEDGARAFSVPAVRVKLEGFALAGFVAGVGGALYSHSLSNVKAGNFSVTANISVIALTVIGGIGLLAGPILGALYIIGIPAFIPTSNAGLAASSFGWLILILYFPGGLAQLVRPLRDATVRLAARGAPPAPAAPADAAPPRLQVTERGPAQGDGQQQVLMSVTGLARHFGGVRAVDGVDLQVYRGETLGLIGPNGAGKTTLFEMLGGFTRPDSGRVVYQGRDITRFSPERRAKLGIIRSFQDAGLFPTLTVLETVQLAQERGHATNTLLALAGATRADRRKEERARELISLMGLDAFVDKQTGELSTGTRRITELTCVIALEPELVLLDEPSSGVAQRETEALGGLLRKVKSHLGTTFIVIEHDMPLITGMADRILALDSGRVIATGTPAEVIADPLVLESYLGGSSLAVERSGHVKAHSTGCAATTKAGGACRRGAVVDGYCSQHAAQLAGAGR